MYSYLKEKKRSKKEQTPYFNYPHLLIEQRFREYDVLINEFRSRIEVIGWNHFEKSIV
jgi:hypothetical protein